MRCSAAVVSVLMAAAGCYSPSVPDCTYACAPGTTPCPDQQVCVDGVCRDPGHTEVCAGAELSLIAGGSGGPGYFDGAVADARFYGPNGVVVDGGTLYVADTAHNLIRAVDLASGRVSTLGGTGDDLSVDGDVSAASFAEPYGLAVLAGHLYVADRAGPTIRDIDLDSGIVSTLAGTAGMPGTGDGTGDSGLFMEPTHLAVDPSGTLYVTDSMAHTVRRITIATRSVTTIAGTAGVPGSTDNTTGTSASFNTPLGVALDPTTSTLYVSDSLNHTIRSIALAQPSFPVTTPAGQVGIPGSMDGLASTARFSAPSGLAFAPGTGLYISVPNSRTIRLLSGNMVSTVAGVLGVPGAADGVGLAATFRRTTGVAFDPGTNRLYLADETNHSIRSFDIVSNEVATVTGHAPQFGSDDGVGAGVRFNFPMGLAYVASEQLVYVADRRNHTIRVVELATGTVETIAGGVGQSGFVDGVGLEARFSQPSGVAFDGTYIYIVDTLNHAIRRYDRTTGAVTTLAGAGTAGFTDAIGTMARFNYPRAIAEDGAGNLYVGDVSSHTIRKVATATGHVTTLAGRGGMAGTDDGIGSAARFRAPRGLAISAGVLFVADTDNHTIRQIRLSDNMVTTLAGTGGVRGSFDGPAGDALFDVPVSCAYDGNRYLYVGEGWTGSVPFEGVPGNSSIRRIDLQTGDVSTVVGKPHEAHVVLGTIDRARLSSPHDLLVLPDHRLIIAEGLEHAILQLDLTPPR
jgi:sugar lactone lactonase YvrE